MPFAPQQDWDAYNEAVAEHELARLQEQTPEGKLERYAHLFDMLHAIRPLRSCDHPVDHPVEIQRWREKLAIRMRYVNAMIKPKKE